MKKYQIIVIDPPWQLKKIVNKQRPNQVEMDYPMMPIEDIAKMPVDILADNTCWCFLWTTQKYIWDSKAIIQGWGFKPMLTMVWEKTYGRSAGMPLYGFRWNAEFILVGTRGKKEMFPKTKLIPVVFQAENIRHSQKPDKFYEMIETLGKPRIDLFARRRRDNWDVWGNEVESDIDFPIANGEIISLKEENES